MSVMHLFLVRWRYWVIFGKEEVYLSTLVQQIGLPQSLNFVCFLVIVIRNLVISVIIGDRLFKTLLYYNGLCIMQYRAKVLRGVTLPPRFFSAV